MLPHLTNEQWDSVARHVLDQHRYITTREFVELMEEYADNGAISHSFGLCHWLNKRGATVGAQEIIPTILKYLFEEYRVCRFDWDDHVPLEYITKAPGRNTARVIFAANIAR